MGDVRLIDGILTFAATDLSDHLGCDHLTTLNRCVADGSLRPPDAWDPLLDILAERGQAHERAYLDTLRASGCSIAQPDATASTLDLMRAGVDVIVQAPLYGDRWVGRADFLVRVPRSSALGAWSYEVHDAKLAAETRAGSLLQICVYSELVGTVQGLEPEYMHIVRTGPDFPRDSYRFAEFAAIYRQLRAGLRRHAEHPGATYPDPRPQCDVCRWWSRCDAQRHADDHLSLVADLGRRQQRELVAHDLATMTALAAAPLPLGWRPERGAVATYERLARQARLQVAARSAEWPSVELLPPAPERGLALLPAPSPGDVFLDLEGDPFIGAYGREYLFGYVTLDGGHPTYTGHWAFDDATECAAFERVVDTIMARWAADPGMHIYHYAPYEPTAFKRLRGRFGTRIDAIDRLLRAKRFIDLYRIVRQGLLAGVENYSIKSLEPIVGFRRGIALDDAAPAIRRLRLALQRGTEDVIEPSWRDAVRRYNEDDCLAARALRDWLEVRRSELVAGGHAIERPSLQDGAPDADRAASDAATQAVAAQLLAGIPLDRAQRDPEQHARWLLAHSVFWYTREVAPEYWDFFRRAELSEDGRFDDAHCIAGLELDRVVAAPSGRRRSAIHRYRFQPQDVVIEGEANLYIDADVRLGTVVAIDLDACTVDVRKARGQTDIHPTSVIVKDVVPAGAKADAVRALAGRVAQDGFPPRHQPCLARDLLLGSPPRNIPVTAGEIRGPDESALACALRLTANLDGAVLPIQGPPGTGKTFIASHMIVELIRRGRRVGVTATSHKVIHNLVERVMSVAAAEDVPLTALVRTDPGVPLESIPGVRCADDSATVDRAYADYSLVAGTAWLWARPGLAGAVDTLFVDEAGQMSLVDALACCDSARSLVLVGDPQQLQQPIKGTHPDGLAVSALEHLLAAHETIPRDRGLFLNETHRLHPAICQFTSEQFYESRLLPGPAVASQALSTGPITAPGLYWLPVDHSGNQSRSTEEASAVADLVVRLVAPSAQPGATPAIWTGPAGPASLEEADIRIVAPYNAHVSAMRDALARRGLVDVPVGTVDKFQGQEGVIAIYSMATSHPDDAPRGLDFLYDRHRLNVATSRARCAAILVCSPALLRPTCRTPHHLHLASALARFVELAMPLDGGPTRVP